MSKFRKGGKRKMQAINTSALPDIIFMLLFFFMVATTMREVTLDLEVEKPDAPQAATKKIKDKNKLKYIYSGFPPAGGEAKIQLNDRIVPNALYVKEFVISEMEKIEESEKPKIRFSLKIDKKVPVGMVNKIEDQIKEGKKFKILYSTNEFSLDE